MSRPDVTVVIPFFHTYAPYLEECLESLRQQTFAAWEAIVVDDASGVDAAGSIVTRLGDSRIRVLYHRRNRGQAAGRNTGIRSGTGTYTVAVDCDDRLAPTHLEKVREALRAHPECGVAYSDFELFGAVTGVQRYPLRDTRALLYEQWLPHPGTLVRRHLWERAGGYCEDEVFRAGNEDWEYWLRLAEAGLSAVRVPEPLYFYRQHASSITSSRFACSDYLMREEMYRRHRALFDAAGAGAGFLAGGYRTSGTALWRKGARGAAFRLLMRAGWLSPGDFIGRAVTRLERRRAA